MEERIEAGLGGREEGEGKGRREDRREEIGARSQGPVPATMAVEDLSSSPPPSRFLSPMAPARPGCQRMSLGLHFVLE